MIEIEKTAALRHLGRGSRGLEESVSYSLGHQIRIEIRAALHEGPAPAAQLAKLLRRPLNTVEYHLKGLLDDGSIVIARTEKVGNLDRYYYAVVELPYFTDHEVAAMRVEDRQALYAMIAQAATAEVLASLWAQKIAYDRRAMLAWNRINLDKQGRDELADEDASSWCRKEEIETRSANRRAETGEVGKTYIITSFSYERSRAAPPEPLAPHNMSAADVASGIAALRCLGTAARSVEDSVSYSLGHRIRIEIRAALHEGPATAAQLAEIVSQPTDRVEHHIREMLSDRIIEVSKVVKVGNILHNHYSVVSLPFFSDEEMAAMSVGDRQALYAMIAQAATAEVLASLWAQKIAHDRRAMLAWNRINLDKQGRDELADEDAASWRRKEEIEARSANRRVETGEVGKTYVITSFSYERSRDTPPEPLTEIDGA